MSIDLDNQNIITRLDPGRVGESIAALPGQIRQMTGQIGNYNLPEDYQAIDRVVLSGMGGSNLGAHLVASALKDALYVPLLIEPGYQVPAYVNKSTLYIVSSYSGTTEEPLSTIQEAKKRGAKLLAITAESESNPLKQQAQEAGFPVLTFSPDNNPSGQPRLGVGYSILAIMGALGSAGVIKLDLEKVREFADWLEVKNNLWGMFSPSGDNPAKSLALDLAGAAPVICGAEHLAGNLHILRNQVCETSKNFATYLELPDLNHFAMEGLANPSGNQEYLSFVFFESGLYSEPVQKRLELTKEVVNKNGLNALSYRLETKTRLGQAWELLQFGAWISYYLGLANGINPVEIPWVDWFKDELKKAK
jgi:glucose/mannose-6-phosphate isomerase